MSTTHEGVSCDTCMKNNFAGRRYKCLICYDFDLCSTCYEAGATNNQHLNTHPMQCILTRADYELYYGGEANIEPQSFTCPYCGKLGFTEITLSEHVTIEHEDDSYEVVCPICAAIPTGDPNHLTEDLLNHINLEHRNLRDNSSNGIDDNTSRFSRRLNSRATTAARRGGRGGGGGGSTFQFGSSSGTSTLSSLVGRDGMDPIAELLSQLSGVRRAVAQHPTLQLQQLQQHLREREREHLQQTRQTSNIFSRMQFQTISNSNSGTYKTSTTTSSNTNNTSNSNQQNTNSNSTQQQQQQQLNPLFNQILELPNIFETLNTNRDNRYLLSKYDNSISNNKSTNNLSKEQQQQQQNNGVPINQSFFIHDILLSTLMNQFENNNNISDFDVNINENNNNNNNNNLKNTTTNNTINTKMRRDEAKKQKLNMEYRTKKLFEMQNIKYNKQQQQHQHQQEKYKNNGNKKSKQNILSERIEEKEQK